MKPGPERETFLRAAVKTGLRMQERFAAKPAAETGCPEMRSDGVATLQKIRASLRRRSVVNPSTRR